MSMPLSLNIESFRWLVLRLYALLVPFVAIYAAIDIGACDLLLPLGLTAVALSGGRRIPTAVGGCLALWIAACLASIVFNYTDLGTPMVTLAKWIRLVGIVCPFFVAASTSHDTAKLRSLLKFFFVGGAIAIGLSTIYYMLGIQIGENQQRIYTVGSLRGGFRAGGVEGNSSAYGMMFSLWSLVSAYYFLTARSHAASLGGLAAVAGLAGVALYTSFSRTALVGILAGATVYAAYNWRQAYRMNRRGAVLASIAFCAMCGAMAVVLLSPDLLESINNRLGTRGADFSSIAKVSSGRTEGWTNFMSSFKQSPLFGHGYKAADENSIKYLDNAFLNLLHDTGLVGFLPFAALNAFLIHQFLTVRRSPQYANLGLALVAMFLAQSFFLDTYTFWTSAPVYFALMAVLGHAAAHRDAREVEWAQ